MTTELNRIHEYAAKLSAKKWHAALTASANGNFSKFPFPGFPAEEIQLQLNGRPATQSMKQANEIYTMAMRFYKAHRSPSSDARYLDFGADWGRIWRYFLRDFKPGNMFAFDVAQHLRGFWQEEMLGAKIDIGSAFEPLPYADQSIDLVTSNSVFSHLTERLNIFSANEIYRVLRPGGLFLGTTFGPAHLRRWKQLQQSGEQLKGRSAMLASLTDDFDEALKAYANGEFVLLQTHQKKKLQDFEIVCFGSEWIRKNWSDFDLLDFDDKNDGQPTFVVRRP